MIGTIPPPGFLVDGPEDAAFTLCLAHGAGAPMDTPFMEFFAAGLAAAGFRVARFEFPYMARRRSSGRRLPPDRAPVLRETWWAAIAALGGPERLVIGGKSMGGRVASLVADSARVAALVCLGYPFHTAGRPAGERLEHLKMLRTPTLIVQGTRDSFGSRAEVAGYSLASSIRLHWLEDGDHGFKPRKTSGRTEDGNWAEGVAAVVTFLRTVAE